MSSISKRTKKPLTKDGFHHGVKFSNETLFLTACANGDIEECQRLLNEKLVDINVTTPDGLSGLHEAVICGNLELIEYLIKNGAYIDCGDYEGWTPLHAAASLGQAKVVSLLLDYGASATIVNCENLLAYDLARNDQVRALIGQYLQDQDLDVDYLRSQEERAIQRDINNWLATGHYDERSHPLTNATVLHVIAAKGYTHLMKQILETPKLKKLINLEAQDNEGFTPLLAASFWSQSEIVELLIEHGANIFAQAHNGYKINSIVSSEPIRQQQRLNFSSTSIIRLKDRSSNKRCGNSSLRGSIVVLVFRHGFLTSIYPTSNIKMHPIYLVQLASLGLL